MTDRSRTTGGDRPQDAPADGFGRREFVALGAGVGATMLAGCAGDGGLASSDGSDGSDGSQTLTGNFRLLISDAPADIADFDQLNVTLDEARIFEARDDDDDEEEDDEAEADDEAEEEDEEEPEGDDDEEQTDQTGNETDTESDAPNGTADEEDDADADDADEDEDDEDDEDDGDDEDAEEEDRGFTVVDLGGATVDLTQVLGDDATAVFDGEIPAGSYEKIELEVSAVEGIVDGAAVDVKLPSEKLQITNAFEVTPDEPVSFVFDINVVKRGPNNGYILKPVISGSGVAGRDVDVNEIDDDDDEEEDDDEGDDDAEDEADSDEDADETEGSEDEEDADDTTTGNETDDAENETAA